MSIEISPSRVLIVEDDPGMVILYEVIFRRQSDSFEAVIKTNGAEGLADFEANKGRTHLVVLDRDLPDMTGEDIAEGIRKISGIDDDPFILMISGRGGSLNTAEMKRRGVSDLLPKPFSPDELLQTLTLANQGFQ